MYVRTAYFIGSVAAGDAERFRSHVETVILPAVRALPGNRGARAMWAREHEDGAPAVFLELEHRYDSADALAAALASPGRTAMRAKLAEVLPLFSGSVVHVNYDATEAA